MTSIVVDVGGTNIRVGLFANGSLSQVQRHKVHSFMIGDEQGDELYQAFLHQLGSVLSPYLLDFPEAPIGIAFPGPVNTQGVVSSAPTLWGNQLLNRPVRQDCQNLLGREVHLLNDISAAVWRYTNDETEDFCLFTLSSGVGNKVFYQGQVLVNQDGQGGELGHSQVAFGHYALPCDCGGKGHLGALSSGRGVVQLCQYEASNRLEDFQASALFSLCEQNIFLIDSHNFVEALHMGDAFSRSVLRLSQHFLVQSMNQLYHAIGIRRFVFIGGFCLAAGDTYMQNLKQVVRQFQWFGLKDQQLDHLCTLGANDDDHSLIGMGYYLNKEGAHA